jgi:acyl-CoA thioesterase FadM
MGRWLRFLMTMLRARRRPPIQVQEPSRLELRVWPTECDASYLNHAALLVLMECGRIDVMVRFGFLSLARANRWYSPITTASIRYYRPVKRFQLVTVVSRVVYWDDDSIWMEFEVATGEQRVATALMKNVVRKKRERIRPEDVLRMMGKEIPPRPASPPSYAQYL